MGRTPICSHIVQWIVRKKQKFRCTILDNQKPSISFINPLLGMIARLATTATKGPKSIGCGTRQGSQEIITLAE
jgi:hypothetical protein